MRSSCFVKKFFSANFHKKDSSLLFKNIKEPPQDLSQGGLSAAAKKETSPQGHTSSGASFKSATTYFHAPFPANYLGHE